jgi:hypothetical protein
MNFLLSLALSLIQDCLKYKEGGGGRDRVKLININLSVNLEEIEEAFEFVSDETFSEYVADY